MSDKPKAFRLGVGPDAAVIEQTAMAQPLGINGETIKALEQANAFVNQHTTATEALALLPQVEALRLPPQLELLDKLRLPASLELLDKFTREAEERERLLARPPQSHFIPVPPPPYDPWPLLKRRRVELAEEEERARLRVRDEWEASKGQAQPPSATPAPAAPKPKRRDLLAPLIEAAQREQANPFDVPAIWASLVEMAEAEKRPLLGVTDEGIKWKDANDEPQFFTFKSLRDRIGRMKKKAR